MKAGGGPGSVATTPPPARAARAGAAPPEPVRIDEGGGEHVLDRDDRRARRARAVAERRARDLEVAGRQRRGALVDDLAHAGEELLVRLGDVAADDDHARVE